MKGFMGGMYSLSPPVLRWFKTNVRDDLLPKVENDKSVTLDLDGVVAFQSEEYTIPEQELIPSFRFYYMTAPAHYAYWPLTFTGWAETTEKFLGKPASLAEAVASTVSVSDSSEQKLRKLYARVPRLLN